MDGPELLQGEKKDTVTAVTGDDALVVCDHNMLNLTCQESNWVIGNGASIHCIPRRDFFSSNTLNDFCVLKMGNDGAFQFLAWEMFV